MDGKRISILKIRHGGSMGDLDLRSTGRLTSYFPHRRRVNFSCTNQVKEFDTSFFGSSSSSSVGALNLNGTLVNDGGMNRSASARSLERLQDETTQSGDFNAFSPFVNRHVPTNQLENSEEPERTGGSMSMSYSLQDVSRNDHQPSSNSFFDNSIFEHEEYYEEIPATIPASSTQATRELHNSPIVNLDIRLERVPIAEVDSESFGSDNTRCSLTMSLSLENVRRSSQQSRERTVSLVRDMSSVEEHTMSGNDDMGSVPGPSSQSWNSIMNQTNHDLANRVVIRDKDRIQYERHAAHAGPPMYFNQPDAQHFANPFQNKVQKPTTSLKGRPPTKLSYGKFGSAETPKRPIPPQQLQQQVTNKDVALVHTSTSPLLPAPPLRKSKNGAGAGFNGTLGMRDSVMTANLWRNSCPSLIYSSASIPMPVNHEPELPATRSVASDTPSTPVRAPTFPSMGPLSDSVGSYSHSDTDSDSPVIVLAIETHDEEGSSSSQSSPPNVIYESDEFLEESLEIRPLDLDGRIGLFNENSSSQEDDSSRNTLHEDGMISRNNFRGEAEELNLPTPNLCLVNNGDCVPAIPSSSCNHEQSSNTSGSGSNGSIEDENEEDEETAESLDEDLERELVDEEQDGGEGEDGEDEDEGEEDKEVGNVVEWDDESEEEEDGDESDQDEGDEEEVNNRSYPDERGVNQEPRIQENLRSVPYKQPEINSSQFFEQSRLGRMSDRSQNEDGVVVREESTLRVNSDVASPLQRDQPSVPPSSSPELKGLFEKLQAYSVKADLDFSTKWEFLWSATDKLSKIAEPEWQALLKYGRIKEFMGDGYVKSIETHRNRLRNPDPLYRASMKYSAEMKRRGIKYY